MPKSKNHLREKPLHPLLYPGPDAGDSQQFLRHMVRAVPNNRPCQKQAHSALDNTQFRMMQGGAGAKFRVCPFMSIASAPRRIGVGGVDPKSKREGTFPPRPVRGSGIAAPGSR